MKLKKVKNNLDNQLLGGNFTNDPSGSFVSFDRFRIESNFTGKINRRYDNVLTTFSKPITLDNIGLDLEDSNMISNKSSLMLNIDRSDLKSYIKYGSTVDYLKTALRNILLGYPASLFVDNFENIGNIENTIIDYQFDEFTNRSFFKIPLNNIINKYGIIFNDGNFNIPDENELRNLNISYLKYCVEINNKKHKILNYKGFDDLNQFVELEVYGELDLNQNEFGNINYSIKFHIKPDVIYFNKYLSNIDGLEKYILSKRLDNNNGFEIIFKEPKILDNGKINYSDRKLVWTTTDKYNLDYEGVLYTKFVESLINIGENYDNTKTDLIYRVLIPSSLNLYDNTQNKKIKKILRLYGRQFDEIKQYIDALSNIDRLTYDKKKNMPDVLVRNLAKSMGWDDLTLVDDDNLINKFFSDEYEQQEDDYLPAQIDIELWRRILLNTNYFWKTKGTRESIVSMFRLIGIPEPFINIKEYVYTVDDIINPNNVELEIEDIYSKTLPYNSKGYPISPKETNNFFFQISGDTDMGQHYMDNFRIVGFNLNPIVDNKKSWVYSGETIREHYSSVQYYQKSSDLVLNTKQIDVTLDIANAVEYDVYDYIKNVDFPNNSGEFTQPYVFINLKSDHEDNVNEIILPHNPIGDVQVSLNGINLTNQLSGETIYDIIQHESFGGGFNELARTIIQDSNGKYVIGGDFTTYQGVSANRIIRLNQDGSRDNTFNIGTGFNNGISSIIQDTNGKYVVVGTFTTYQGVSANRIIRLNQDGSRDNTFDMGTGFVQPCNLIIVDNNDKYIASGSFISYKGVSIKRLIRINQDGSIDNTFNVGDGLNGAARGIIQDSNGKYVLSGQFETYQGVSVNRIIRINQDGSIDNTFNVGTGFNNQVFSMIRDNNDKYIIGGTFTTYQGVSANRIIRINQDGSRDNTFNIGTGFNGSVFCIYQGVDNKHIVSGSFTTYQGVSANRIIRLNQDGSNDNTFNIGTGFNESVLSVNQDINEKYIMVGLFTTYNNTTNNRIIRLNKNSTSSSVGGDGDYEVDENNNKIIRFNTNLFKNSIYDDIVVISYLYHKNGENVVENLRYCVKNVSVSLDGTKIILPDKPNGDVQLTLNGVTLIKATQTSSGEYIVNPINDKELIIMNQGLIDYLQTNPIIQAYYLTSDTNYGMNQKIEFLKIDNFNTQKFYFNPNINRYVYQLDYRVNNAEDLRLTLNGFTLTPNIEYEISTTNKYLVYLPTNLLIGDVLGFYYVIMEDDSFNITIPDEFGVGDISKLSFLEFIELIETKMINVKNRKTITDNNGGFYPTLLRVYIQYLNRSNLPDDNILQSNGYTYENLYPFLNKYNSYFYRFIDKLLPATIILRNSGFMVRNTAFTRQKFTYKRGVNLTQSELEWYGDDGSEFRINQDI